MQYSTNDHQQHARWRMTFTILCFLGVFASLSETAPTNVEPKLPSLKRLADNPKDQFGERVGSPIELAWQTWLIVSKSEKNRMSEDPATFVRRITPKSIFIAPELNSDCNEQNYDENRCRFVKTLNVNSNLQHKFLLDQLNAMHDQKEQEEQEEQNQSKIYDIAGPFQLNIPFNNKEPNNDGGSKVSNTPKPSVPIAIPLKDAMSGVEIKLDEDVSDDDGNENKKTRGKLGDESLPEHIPVIDFVHGEANDGYRDSVVDYKIPLSTKQIVEEKQTEKEGVNESAEEADNEEQLITTTTTTTPKYIPPTLIVLLSRPTKAPAESELDEIVKRMENSTGNWTSQDFLSSIIPIASDEHKFVNKNPAANATQEATIVNSTQENDDIYSDEDPSVTDEDIDNQEDYSTEDSITESVDDDFAETTEDELLKPGEAGITIPIITSQPLDKADWHKEDLVDKMTSIETPEEKSTMKPLNASLSVEEIEVPKTMKPEDTDVNVSSEVSINGDFILETTLLDVNTEKIKNATESAATNIDFVTVRIENNDEVPEKFESEKELVPKPELVFSTSPQEQRPPLLSQIKPVIVWGVDEETAKRQNSNPLKVNLGLPVIQKDDTIVEQASYNSEKVVQPDPGQKFQPIPLTNYKQHNLGFVRFPNYEERPHSSSYVRFPSDEVNSIHNMDFKSRLPHPRDEFVSTTSTKSSVPFFQKPSHWHRGSRTDRQHSGFKQHWSESNRQPKVKHQANLQNIWGKLPDSVHLPTTSHGSHNEPYGGDVPRRSRFKQA